MRIDDFPIVDAVTRQIRKIDGDPMVRVPFDHSMQSSNPLMRPLIALVTFSYFAAAAAFAVTMSSFQAKNQVRDHVAWLLDPRSTAIDASFEIVLSY